MPWHRRARRRSVAKSLATPPANLRKLGDKYGMPLPAHRIAEFIDGRDTARAHGNHEMPVWGEKLYEMGQGERGEYGIGEVIGKIIAYLDTIQDRRTAMRYRLRDSLRDDAEYGIARCHLLELRQRRVAADVEMRAGAGRHLQISLEDWRAPRHRHILEPYFFRCSMAEHGGARAGVCVAHPVGVIAQHRHQVSFRADLRHD